MIQEYWDFKWYVTGLVVGWSKENAAMAEEN